MCKSNNNNIYSVNLTASASNIGDANIPSLSSELNSLNLQQQISIATINNANVTNGYLNRFFSVTASSRASRFIASGPAPDFLPPVTVWP